MKMLLNVMAVVAVLSAVPVNAQQDVAGLTASERTKAAEVQAILQKHVGHLAGDGLNDEMVVLNGFLQIVDSLSGGLDKDLTRSDYKDHLRRKTDLLFTNNRDSWENARDGVLNLLYPDSVSTIPTANERISARRIAKQAVQLEIFRRSGKDGVVLGPEGQIVVTAVGKIFRATKLSLTGPPVDGPRLDPRKAATIKQLLKIFSALETTFDPSMPVSTYKPARRY